MTVSERSWTEYIERLRSVSDEAAKKFAEYYKRVANPFSEEGRKALAYYAYILGRDYGEAAAALACEMYDSMVLASGIEAGWIAPAMPASTVTLEEAAKTINGVLKVSENEDMLASAVGRLVKLAGVDTILENAYRDRPRSGGVKHRHSGAQVAWIPVGDTCPFCMVLASRGWQYQTVWAAENHAEHVHPNCDCTYAVRFNADTNVEGYNPEKYLKMYSEADVNNFANKDNSHPTTKQTASQKRVNAMRREYYAENKDRINAQKREAYAKRKEGEEE